jgi:hypothetical protein
MVLKVWWVSMLLWIYFTKSNLRLFGMIYPGLCLFLRIW